MKTEENVRDISSASDLPMTTGHYLRSMKQLTNQWTLNNYRDERRQRLYLKDIDCPQEWHDALQKVIHPNLFYLNENASETGGEKSQDDIFREEATAAPAGDLMSSLPEEMRAQNLMCYIGHEGTYTPAHREMCASLGQNIMVEASSDENGEKEGSSIWFMTESKDREVVREYFLSMLGHDIEIEKHFAQINGWKKATFDVYVVEQKVGDFILIPPLAAHQVWNRGTRTMKVAWNRTTAETLELALHEALPKARLVCRDEQYKNKAIIYYTLKKYHRQMLEMERNAETTQMSFLGLGREIMQSSPRAKQLAGDFRKLFALFTDIILDEMFGFREKDVEMAPFDSNITCSYCRSNIFNRFLTCKHCVRTLINGDEDVYDICMECYAMGRSCACMSNLQWCEQWSWTELVDNYEDWRSMVIKNDGFVDFDSSPQPLEVARLRARKKSVAQICQEALRRRPWKDITKQEREKTPSDSEPEGEEKKKPKRKKKKKGEVRRCHVCAHKDYTYKIHSCTNPGCTESYCYGVLYRAFDMMPQKVLEDEQWQCPKCLGICNCGYCRRVGHTDPYTPKNTLLGHDTRPIADDRSIEALVDFRVHNLSWLKAAGEESRSRDSNRMKRLREQADNAKAQDLAGQVENSTSEPHAGIENGAVDNAHTSTTGGYGDQSHVLGQGHHMAKADFEEPYPLPEGETRPASVPDAPMDVSQMEDADTCLYPDLSPLVSRQRIGMGYYEQDDTPDKILFDPFQAPTEETMRFPEPNIPEFVKKSIRAAKRKAKRESEDPDFVMTRSHKKARLTAEPDYLDSMDPALFGNGPVAPEAIMVEPPQGDANQVTNQDAEGAEPVEPAQQPVVSGEKRTQPRYDANEPSLRHSKPRASYVELEIDHEESEEDVHHAAKPPPRQTTGTEKSTVDLAAEAVRALFQGSGAASETKAPTPVEAFATTPAKRRGRPPRNAQSSTSTPAKSSPANPNGSTKRRRGRPPKASRLSNVMTADDMNQDDSVTRDAEDVEHGSGVEHDKLVQELAVDVVQTDTPVRRRGRPRKSGVTTIAAHAAEADLSDGESEVAEPTSATSRAVTSAQRSKRLEESEATPTTKKSAVPGGSGQFLSMAERMALKGKKFKIGTRKPKGNSGALTVALPVASPTTTNGDAAVSRKESRQPSIPGYSSTKSKSPSNGFSSNSFQRDSSRSPSRPRRGRHTSSATIVRLEESEEESSNTASYSDSGSGEDIPARGHIASRGGRGRGRGRPRGRGRGRGLW